MTYNFGHIVGIIRFQRGAKAPEPPGPPTWLGQAWVYLIGCHTGHLLDFCAALLCYFVAFPLEEAAEWHADWVFRVVGFNVLLGWALNGFWHWFVYLSPFSKRMLSERKFNPVNPYQQQGQQSGPTAQFRREFIYTTLGWLQSAAFQCVMMWLWASNQLPCYLDFWAHPVYSIGHLWVIAYWREIHFYWVHRMIHPWRRSLPLIGDPGAFLYKHVHSLHHKSYNPGPWSGLCMHPVEHFVYYTCTLLPLVFTLHPMHFLYVKFHADIAPIAGHDGLDTPAGNGDFHYLHHAKFEVNYGVPFPFNFDKYFGTWMDPTEWKEEAMQKRQRR
eukprot:NODE_589_length_1277_cov_421.285016_g424_i0.p1 GENE.NODE_589_length_1277_cov_421.285016_g424_i0~~NODE_589_length_1277_cov_421.285016_g424_i0.p1  ORF type:complete len:358 (-),score=106.95 NODE_589_length_1277_cov_421.285016_g424_i0:203-1189(-)